MAEVNASAAVVFGVQTTPGVIEPSIAALAAGAGSGGGGEIVTGDGLVLGDPESGFASSGISLAFGRGLREKGVAAGSLTKLHSDFVQRLVRTFGFTHAVIGSGATATPLDNEYQPPAGIDALLQGGGWTGAAWGSGNGWRYAPASAQILSAKLWLWDDDAGPDQALWIQLKDIIASGQLTANPAEVGKIAHTLGSVYDAHGVAALPTFDYGVQATLSAPIVGAGAGGAGFQWGVVRNMTALQVRWDNATQQLPRSNVTGGLKTRQTGRTITIQTTVLVDDADMAYELDQLGNTGAPTDPLQVTIGEPAGAGATINALRFAAPTPQLEGNLEAAASGIDGAYNAELTARSATPNGEAELIFL